MALSRQLANATMIRGPGFSVVQAVEPDAMVTLHVAGIQQVLQYIQDGTGNKGYEPAFFKGLSNLLATVSSTDAMKMYVSILTQPCHAAPAIHSCAC